MNKFIGLVLIATFTFSSCEYYYLAIPGNHLFEIINESSNDILIKSFEKKGLIDSISIKSKESFTKVVEDHLFMDNPTIFGSMLVDSVAIINENGKSIILSCGGQVLFGAANNCPEIKNSIIYMSSNTGEEIRKRVDGKFIIWHYTISYTDSDFQ